LLIAEYFTKVSGVIISRILYACGILELPWGKCGGLSGTYIRLSVSESSGLWGWASYLVNQL
jgi:hypothetical protein